MQEDSTSQQNPQDQSPKKPESHKTYQNAMNTFLKSNPKFLHKFSIAPMMDVTHTHYRFFARLLTRHSTLWTEMFHADALLHNENARKRALFFHPVQHPVICQLGGNNPESLRKAAKLVEDAGFDEIDLNCGCPSPKVTKSAFGAVLMKSPDLVAECVKAMMEEVSIPVHVKCRIGVDEFEDYAFLKEYVDKVRDVGCKRVIVHARKAFLKGLNPAQNRSVPPLKYEVVLQLAKDYPDMEISINGGFKNLDSVEDILVEENGLKGCMVGRMAYQDPWKLNDVDRRIYGQKNVGLTRKEILAIWADYGDSAIEANDRLGWDVLIKPIIFLYKDEEFNGVYRRFLANLPVRRSYEKFSGFVNEASRVFEEVNPEAANRSPL